MLGRVLIADHLSPTAGTVLAKRGLCPDVKADLLSDELRSTISYYDAIIVRSATKVTAEVIEEGKNLKVIGRAGAGIDNIDINAATKRGIVVMNTPWGNSLSTAEHTIALILSLARQIPLADRSTQEGKWERGRFMGLEISGKTLGIIGCGKVGSIVADRGLALKMEVIAFDPYLSDRRARIFDIEKVDLDSLLRRSDFITLHAPLTEETRNLIDVTALSKCRRGVRIINSAQGELIVEEDLRSALESGHVAGAALDVFSIEPARSSPLFGRLDVIATPHLGASTVEAQENVAYQIAQQVCDFLIEGRVLNAVNGASGQDVEVAKTVVNLPI